MRIAASDDRLVKTHREVVRQTVRPLQHLAIDCFDSMKITCKNREVVFRSRSREAGIEVIDSYEQATLDCVGKQALDIVAAALQFDMVVFRNAINAGVHFRAARHRAGDFFAEEEIGITPQILYGINGIVVGNRDEIHAALFQACVQRARLVVRLHTNPGEHRYSAHPE